jgi:hypothetical protein
MTSGPDKQVPPGVEGHACHARGIGMDDPTWRGGRDKHVPPSGRLRWKGLASIAALVLRHEAKLGLWRLGIYG